MSEATNPPRRFHRVPVRMSVRLSTIDPEPDPRTGRPCFRNVREYSANLSKGGVFIRTRDPVSPGHRVLVQFHLADDGPVEAVGRVAWSRRVLRPRGEAPAPAGDDPQEAGAGVEFLEERNEWERLSGVLGIEE